MRSSKQARLQLVSLRTGLVNLPLSLHATLLERGITPQSLVVELSTAGLNPKKHYVGWSGMPSAQVGVADHVVGRGGMDVVEMDPQFAAMLGPGMVDGAMVTVELLRDIPSATSVSVTPVTADDWEVLEANAEFIEMNLLSQVRAVNEGMTVGCWARGGVLVKFLVDSVEPSLSPSTSALRLTSDTELIVAPKARASAVSATKKHDLATVSASGSSSATSVSVGGWDALKKTGFRLLPSNVDFLVSGQPSTSSAGASLAAVDEPSIFVPTGIYRAALEGLPSLRCTVQKAPRSAPSGSSSSAPTSSRPDKAGRESESGSEVPHHPRDRKSKSSAPSLVAGQVIRATVAVKEGKWVPAGHVWLSPSAREAFAPTLKDFEVLKLSRPVSRTDEPLKSPLPKQNGLSPSSHNVARRSSASARDTPPLSRQTSGLGRPVNGISADNAAVGSSSEQPSVPVLAGVDEQIGKGKRFVVERLVERRLRASTNADGGSAGLLITGSSGSGKTVLAERIASDLKHERDALTYMVHVDCSKFSNERLIPLRGKMKEWFDEACWHAPSVLVLDNLDGLVPAEVEHADSFPALQIAHAFVSAAASTLASWPVALIATCQSSTSIHALLTSSHLFGETIALRGPDKTARREILTSLIKAKTLVSNLEPSRSLDYTTLSGSAEGYLPADLRDLVDRAIHQAVVRAGSSQQTGGKLELTNGDFELAQVNFVPLSLREVKLQKAQVAWSDIGGLHETRQTLRETLEWPTKYGAIFASAPLRLRSGLLLYGFPGCGKTLLASAVANECGLNFISVKGPEILNKYIGASEKSVRDLFERAQAAKPCVLFFDEFDSIAPKRGHDSTGVTDRVVNQMLTQMDGAEGLDGVYVLAATSRPDLIDPALLRPGRLDKSLLCDMPSYEDRLEILQACAGKIALSPGVDMGAIARETEGFSGADLQAVVYNAHLDCVQTGLADMDLGEGGGGAGDEDVAYVSVGGAVEANGAVVKSRAEQAAVSRRMQLILDNLGGGSSPRKAVTAHASSHDQKAVQQSHLVKSLKATRPSVPKDEAARLRRIYNEFVSGRSPNGLPSGEASDEIGGRSSLM